MTPRAVAAALAVVALVAAGRPSPGALAQSAAQPAAPQPPTDLAQRVAELDAWRLAEHAKLQASGKATAAAYKTIDDLYLIKGRQMHETVRNPALRALETAAGVRQGALEQGGAGTKPEFGRGAPGDVDTGSMGGRQFESVRQTAKKLGYTVHGEGDYFTIKELGTTVHREPTRYTSAPGSSARQAEINRGLGHETSYNVNSPAADANVAALKNLEKGAHTLNKPPADLSLADVQELAKMTQRNMDAGGIRTPRLRAQVDMMKAGYSPEAAAVVPANASPAEKAAAMGEFQRQARDVNTEAVKTTQARANETMGQLRDTAAAAEAKLAKARAAGNGDAVAAARQELIAAKTEATEFQAQQRAARDALIRNNPEGARVMAEAQGMKVEPVNGPNGPRYRTSQGMKTPSQLTDALVEPPAAPGPAASRLSRGLNNIGMGLMVLGLYHGVMEAQERAGREAGERGDSALTSVARLGAYSVWNGLGGAWAVQSGQEGQARSMAQYQEDLAKGRVDSMSFGSFLYARARGVTSGVYQFLGLKGIEDAHADYMATKKELLELAVHDFQAEAALAADRKRSEERAARAAGEKAAAEKAALEGASRSGATGASRPAAPRSAPKPAAPPAPAPAKDDASVMPNLVRTSWTGEITLQGGEGPAIVLPLTLSIDSYNKISGSLPWSAWFDDEPNQRTLELTGTYDGRTGAFSVQANRTFTSEATLTQVVSVPTGSGMGTENKTIQVKEVKRSGLRVRLAGNVDGSDAARGNAELTVTSEIVVDEASQGAGTDEIRGTWRLRRTR